jgi:Spy/CpxP family protein refolding chaperone
MKNVRLFLLFVCGLIALSSFAYGQDGPPPDGPEGDRPERGRPNLLAELGLSRDQIQQIRRINQERRPEMMRAQRRLREANRALDMAIYADSPSDAEFQTRLAEFRTAQSEIARLRFESELAVRKILTPDQLIRFRELRRKFAEARQADRPNRRLRRRGEGPPPMDLPPAERPNNQ